MIRDAIRNVLRARASTTPDRAKHKLREAGNGPGAWDSEALNLAVTREERR